MLYAIRLDPGSIEERLFVCPEQNLEEVRKDLNKYCESMEVDGPFAFLEVSVPTVTYDPQDLDL